VAINSIQIQGINVNTQNGNARIQNMQVYVTGTPRSTETLTLTATNAQGQVFTIPQQLSVALNNQGFQNYNTQGISLTSPPAGNYTFTISGGGQSSTYNTAFYICFLAGTLISTPGGARAVEELAVGDLVLTAAGRAVPVMFVGRQTIHARFAPAETSRPIRISAGALGENLPERDLWVSPSHAILVDGTLCHARALVNGTTIAQLPAPTEMFTYYSVELEAHEVILAEGAPVESFADHVSRGRFDNAAEFEVLYPQGRVVGEMDLPLAKSARQLPAGARAVIAARAELLAPAARAA